MDIRDLCRILSDHLGVDARSYAARLVRAGILPRARERICAHEAAALLLAVLGSGTPERAESVFVILGSADLVQLQTATLHAGGIIAWTTLDPESPFLPRSTWAALSAEISDRICRAPGGRIQRMTVDREAMTLDVEAVIVQHDDTLQPLRATFGISAPSDGQGIVPLVRIGCGVIDAIADALRPNAPVQPDDNNHDATPAEIPATTTVH